eukprot:s4244_g2.t1
MSARRSWRVRKDGYHPTVEDRFAEHGERFQDGAVERFQGPYKFLSNFFWSQLDYEGLCYPSVEHAFQAAKLRRNEERLAWGFTGSVSFGEAKRLGRQVPLREDWKEIREEVMASCLSAKFSDPSLREKLLRTGNRELIDGHSGSPDLIWGYHIPSQKGENRLGLLLMDLRSKLRSPETASGSYALFHLDWPVKCLHDGLPKAYAARIRELALGAGLSGCSVVLPRRKICIALCGRSSDIDAWEHRMRTEDVDVNSRGRPCRERMLVELLRRSGGGACDTFSQREAKDWNGLCHWLSSALGLEPTAVAEALGPEPPELPKRVEYLEHREAVRLDGRRYLLCLNETVASTVSEGLLAADGQAHFGTGEAIPLCASKKPSIFGGKFARQLAGLLSKEECQRLIEISEAEGYGLAGSRGFNPFARYAFRCLLDAPQVAAAVTRRLAQLLPSEYPTGSGQQLLGVNQRLRFLKYLPGMHHADHTDCAHEDENGRSFLTIQLYLNTDFTGGRTTFISDRLVPIEPSTGGAIVFDHELYHRGEMVTSGQKYALRMDVSYQKPGASSSPPVKTEVEERRRGRWGRK